MTIFVTGAAGYVGRQVVQALAEQAPDGTRIVATDVRPPPELPGVDSRVVDIRDPALATLLAEVGATVVVHLAAVVTPPPGMEREQLHDIEVGGTDNVLRACVEAGVERFVYTSSGAAYGYRADNPALLTEDDALRGNREFAYSWHKRLVEELLERYRAEHPGLEQLVFRVSTILGPSVDNQITALFERPVSIGIRGVDTPFCFAWDADVVACIVQGALQGGAGTFNLTGDGAMTLREIAAAMGQRYVALPEQVLRRGLASLHKRGWSRYGPEQVGFLAHRPVLSNERLKRDFGYVPRLSSREVFDLYRQSRGR